MPAQAAERLITVTGHGMVAVAPDTATIRIGVTSQGKTAREASAANAQQMTKVLTAIEQSGIAKKDIQTSRLSLQPQYDAKNGANRLLGFQVTNQITVRIHNIDNLPSLLDKAIAAGANEMSGIEFLVSGESKLLDQARADAIADAHRKAVLYAQAAGAKVGKVVAIVEQGASPPPQPFQALRSSGAAVPVAPGEQMLRATVTVSYELGSESRRASAEQPRGQPPQAAARASRKAFSRSFRVSAAARSNWILASASRPARNRKSPLAAGNGA